jgi:Uma2 family endonuclease
MTTSINLNFDLDETSLSDDETSLDDDDVLYPSGDGKPLAESTEQYRWIVYLKENLEILFAAYTTVFIAADLFWYPIQVDTPPAPRQAPDVMVIFGRPKGKRRSYRQWTEDNIPPQVVFEILSTSNRTRAGKADMADKFRFYESYGVEEYYIYDPDKFVLQGWLRQNGQMVAIANITDWTSPRLGIRMVWQPRQELQLFYPNGESFLNSIELKAQVSQALQQAEQERRLAEQERRLAEQASMRADQERQRAEQERRLAEQASMRADQERQRAEQAEVALATERERLAALEAELAKLRAGNS